MQRMWCVGEAHSGVWATRPVITTANKEYCLEHEIIGGKPVGGGEQGTLSTWPIHFAVVGGKDRVQISEILLIRYGKRSQHSQQQGPRWNGGLLLV